MSDENNVEKGTEYELFVQSVYDALIQSDGVENVSVQHNIDLTGKSGCKHQIDVYWEFKLAGHVYRTAIECKAFNKNVSIGRVRDFYGVILDIPHLNGIFATIVGYQSGAKKYADHYGIELKEIRVPTPEDWKGRIKDIVLNIHILETKIVQLQPVATKEFLASVKERIELKLGIWNNVPILFNSDGLPVATYEELRQSLPTDGAPFTGKEYYVPYPNHRLETPKAEAESISMPIEGIKFVYDVAVDVVSSKILGDQLAHAIIQDVKTGKYTFIDKNGSVRSPRDP